MSFLDSAKEAAKKAAEQAQVLAGQAADKSKEFAADHKDQVGKAIDRGQSLADRQTKGKYTGQISKVAGKAGELVDKIPEKD